MQWKVVAKTNAAISVSAAVSTPEGHGARAFVLVRLRAAHVKMIVVLAARHTTCVMSACESFLLKVDYPDNVFECGC